MPGGGTHQGRQGLACRQPVINVERARSSTISRAISTGRPQGILNTLGPVFVIDPTGLGNRYDPLHGRMTEDELYSSAHHLLYQAHEGEAEVFTLRSIVMLTLMLYAARREGLRLSLYPLA